MLMLGSMDGIVCLPAPTVMKTHGYVLSWPPNQLVWLKRDLQSTWRLSRRSAGQQKCCREGAEPFNIMKLSQ